jgi:ABC transport system ATP-binding/permease protein
VTLVSAEGLVKRYAEKTVLDGVTVGVGAGERVGVIGVNGSGKSTLLRVLAGEEEPDQGRMVHANDCRIAYLSQDPSVPEDRTLVEVVAGRDASPEVQADARGLLHHLGMPDAEQPVGARSGGERKRIALARTLVADADLLVLDEPTNHLDVDMIEWLEARLLGHQGALLLVTHDRYLLDRVATRIVELHDAGLHTHAGGYASYLEARILRVEQAEARERKRQARARVELAWLRRGPRARTSKSKFRVEQAHALLTGDEGTEQAGLAIDLPARRIGSKVVNLHNAGRRYGNRWVLEGVDWKLQPGERAGLVGPNGAGKTTLLRLIAGLDEPDAGSVRHGSTVHVGWYGQDLASIPPRTRVLDAVREVVLETNTVEGITLSADQLLERFLFTREAQKAYVSELSGGERRRLELLRVLADAPNLLLLDEPTNDLDLDTLAVLEEFLDGWAGALVVATHDRFFLDRVCDDVYALTDGRLRHHPGGWEAYRAARVEADRPARREPRGRPPQRERVRRLTYNEQRELAILSERVPSLEQRKAELEAALRDEGEDFAAAGALGEELTAVLAELERAETRWLELTLVEEDV